MADYCQKNNKKFCIALSSNREDKQNKISATNEINNFKKYTKLFKIRNLDSITLSEFSELCVCTNSNLGYELLLAKMKILFLSIKSEKWRFFERNNSAFWYFGDNKSKIEEKISNLLQFKQSLIINFNHYFKVALTYSPTGFYAPTFRLSSNTIFSDKGCNIFLFNKIGYYSLYYFISSLAVILTIINIINHYQIKIL